MGYHSCKCDLLSRILFPTQKSWVLKMLMSGTICGEHGGGKNSSYQVNCPMTPICLCGPKVVYCGLLILFLAFFTWPLTFLSPVLGYNLGVIAMVAFASFATRFLQEALGVVKREKMIAFSIGVCCSAWLIGEIHNGISESVNIGFGALALALVERASQNRQTTKIHQNPWLWAGISVGGCFWVSPYLGLLFPLRHSFVRSHSSKKLGLEESLRSLLLCQAF